VKAEARVTLLLRTLDDARVAREANAAGGGALLMPSAYHEGSYAELERRLDYMRDNGGRKPWWHATRRYRGRPRPLPHYAVSLATTVPSVT
jgi:hypothetical protein